MKKVVRLTEADLYRIISKVLSEQPTNDDQESEDKKEMPDKELEKSSKPIIQIFDGSKHGGKYMPSLDAPQELLEKIFYDYFKDFHIIMGYDNNTRFTTLNIQQTGDDFLTCVYLEEPDFLNGGSSGKEIGVSRYRAWPKVKMENYPQYDFMYDGENVKDFSFAFDEKIEEITIPLGGIDSSFSTTPEGLEAGKVFGQYFVKWITNILQMSGNFEFVTCCNDYYLSLGDIMLGQSHIKKPGMGGRYIGTVGSFVFD